MNKIFKVLSVLIATLLILSLFACGDKKTQDDTSENTDQLETVEEGINGDFGESQEEITLIEIPIEE